VQFSAQQGWLFLPGEQKVPAMPHLPAGLAGWPGRYGYWLYFTIYFARDEYLALDVRGPPGPYI
jgi:hypothetical protein